MASELESSPLESAGVKAAAFRKPSNDVGNRKYRRRSPLGGSPSSDGTPDRELSGSLTSSKEDPPKVSSDRRRKDDGRDLDRDYGRTQYVRNDDSHRHSDRQSSRSSHSYHRHDDYNRREKHGDEDERKFSKFSARTGLESKGGTHSVNIRRESDRNRSSDHYSQERLDGSGHRGRDKDRETSSFEYKRNKNKDFDRAGSGSGLTQSNFSIEGKRDKHKGDRDEKKDYQRSLRDPKSDHSPIYEEASGHRTDSSSRRDRPGHRLKESSWSDSKEMVDEKYAKQKRRKYDERETDRHKGQDKRESSEQFEGKTAFTNEDQEAPSRKPKLFGMDKGADHVKDGERRLTSSSKQEQEFSGKVTSKQDFVTDSDIDAAKVAALKAAELVNKNLIGTGYMSIDQKKKLLWGKKSTTVEESTQHWDASLFSDRERQEKFNKLMGVKGEVKVEHNPDNQDGNVAEKQKELQLDLEKQYTAGLRRRDGRTVGLGL